jgi:hypothetical protein
MANSRGRRTDLSVDIESVDLSIPRPRWDAVKGKISQRTQLCILLLSSLIRLLKNVYSRVKRKKELNIDPNIVELNSSFEVIDKRPPCRFANHISPGRIPTLATITSILLPEHNYSPPTSAHLYGATNIDGGGMCHKRFVTRQRSYFSKRLPYNLLE